MVSYPATEPYETGMLDVGDGQRIAWETSGNPEGKPALVVHGGPGSGRSAGTRGRFDPRRYRVIQYDQRGCGQSTPSAADPATDLSRNTTWHLVEDMEALRRHLGVERWLLLGGSWGSTLVLAYAQRHPERVAQIVIPAVTTTRRSEIDWLYRGVGRYFPEQWQRFLLGSGLGTTPGATGPGPTGPGPTSPGSTPGAFADGGLRDGRHGTELAAAYARLLVDPDPAVRARATADWLSWEDTVLSLEGPDGAPPPAPYARRPPEAQMAMVRICTHYFAHAAWLTEGQLLAGAHLLSGVPGVLIHGRLDLGSPAETAWELARRWTEADLTLVREAGHLATETTRAHIEAALDRFAEQP